MGNSPSAISRIAPVTDQIASGNRKGRAIIPAVAKRMISQVIILAAGRVIRISQ
jgi:hypothetical protein